jgi:hypothetical protein
MCRSACKFLAKQAGSATTKQPTSIQFSSRIVNGVVSVYNSDSIVQTDTLTDQFRYASEQIADA